MFSGGGTRYQYFLNFSGDSIVQPELRTSVLEILMGMVWGVSWQWDFYSSLGDSHRQSHALMKPWAMGSNKDKGDSVHQGRTRMTWEDSHVSPGWTEWLRVDTVLASTASCLHNVQVSLSSLQTEYQYCSGDNVSSFKTLHFPASCKYG